jgi:hypothetical protein
MKFTASPLLLSLPILGSTLAAPVTPPMASGTFSQHDMRQMHAAPNPPNPKSNMAVRVPSPNPEYPVAPVPSPTRYASTRDLADQDDQDGQDGDEGQVEPEEYSTASLLDLPLLGLGINLDLNEHQILGEPDTNSKSSSS